MGGKSSPAPAPAPPPDYMAQAQAQMLIQRQQQEFEANQQMQLREFESERQRRLDSQQEVVRQQQMQKEQQTAQEAAAEKARLSGQRTNQFNAYSDVAGQYDDQMLGNLGFEDKYGIADSYNQQLNAWKSATGADLDNYKGTAPAYQQMWQDAYGQAQTRERGNLQRSFTNMTNPGWESGYFADTMDDSILESILNEQYGAATTQFDTAQKRGQVTDGAFSSAMSNLDNKKLIANSNLQDLGMGVIGGYRGQLSDQGRQYADRVSSWNLGDSFNMDYVTNGFNQTRDNLTGRLEGDVRRAVGDTQLFDTAGLLAQAGVQGGVANNPLQSAFNAQTVKDDETAKRTTGTAGVF